MLKIDKEIKYILTIYVAESLVFYFNHIYFSYEKTKAKINKIFKIVAIINTNSKNKIAIASKW